MYYWFPLSLAATPHACHTWECTWQTWPLLRRERPISQKKVLSTSPKWGWYALSSIKMYNVQLICPLYLKSTFSSDFPHHQRDPTVPANALQNRASSQGTHIIWSKLGTKALKLYKTNKIIKKGRRVFKEILKTEWKRHTFDNTDPLWRYWLWLLLWKDYWKSLWYMVIKLSLTVISQTYQRTLRIRLRWQWAVKVSLN